MNIVSIDHIINTIRTKIKEKYNFHTDAEINAFLLGMTEEAEDSKEAIEKRDKMLRDTVAELVDAKRLLKLAVDDMTKIEFGNECIVCDKKLLPDGCPIHNNISCNFKQDFKWRYLDEALKLIGEDD
jgi:hypothetical protein